MMPSTGLGILKRGSANSISLGIFKSALCIGFEGKNLLISLSLWPGEEHLFDVFQARVWIPFVLLECAVLSKNPKKPDSHGKVRFGLLS